MLLPAARSKDPDLAIFRYGDRGAGQRDIRLRRAFARHDRRGGGFPVTFNIILLQPLVALLAGILILAIPRLLNVIVAIYLILIGIAGLWPHVLR
jgi:hypothetical protein